MTEETRAFLLTVTGYLEEVGRKYLATKEKRYWYDLIQLLPSSFNQTRTCTLNYENLIILPCAPQSQAGGVAPLLRLD
jgi:hypothetical protein